MSAVTWSVCQNFRRKYGLLLCKRNVNICLSYRNKYSGTNLRIWRQFCLMSKTLTADRCCSTSFIAHLHGYAYVPKRNFLVSSYASLRNSSNDKNILGNGEEKRRYIKEKKEARRQQLLERQKAKAENPKLKKGREEIVYNILTPAGEKKDITNPLPKAYSPPYVEASWYEWWEKQGFFSPDYQQHSQDVFTMVLPPPNVTGTLHLGHALGNSIQDAIARWHRMKGHRVLWNPGCDHAGIATQVVVEKKLWLEKKQSRHDIGRENFLKEVWRWKEEKGDRIYDQMRKLGSSLDWSRACFTLDPKLAKAVNEAFIRLHNEGLIYRSNRLVNWSCALRSTISDMEVDNIPVEGKTFLKVPGYDKKIQFGTITTINYPIKDSSDKIAVATTRPETMLGDTAIAVHPDDKRYQHLHGHYALHPLCDRLLPIICDPYVLQDFGTGAVKITPAHDPNDHNMGKKHNLESVNILDDSGRLINVPDQFKGMNRFDARKKVLSSLSDLGLLGESVDHAMSIPVCSRTGDIIEPRLKEQWFVDCEEMAAKAIQAVKEGNLKLVPTLYKQQWYDWLSNTSSKDWCISRQLWWGHRVPAYQVLDMNSQTVEVDGVALWVSDHSEDLAREKASQLSGLGTEQLNLIQDDDVLDTWFSSAVFPFSIFGWPEKTSDLSRFYPTNILETAADIIFFWVARMVMFGEKLTGQLPFKEVLFHGILQDALGRKMSKSLGNIIDPMDVIHGASLETLQKQLAECNLGREEIEKALKGQKRDFPLGIPQCGTDALRFSLCSFTNSSQFNNVDVVHIKSNRHFCNKIWQAMRYTLSNIEDYQPLIEAHQLTGHESPTDLWMLSCVSHLLQSCDQAFQTHSLNVATKALHTFWWRQLCDVYLEYSKVVLQSDNSAHIYAVRQTLHTCMNVGLRALHPFMPFLTEELYQRLPKSPSHSIPSVCVAPYPQVEEYNYRNTQLEDSMELVTGVVSQALSARKILNMTKAKANLYITDVDDCVINAFRDHLIVLKVLSRSNDVSFLPSLDSRPEGCLTDGADPRWKLHMEIKGLVDVDKEVSSLQQQNEKLNKELHTLLEDSLKHPEDIKSSNKEEIQSKESQIAKFNSIISQLITIR